MSSFESKRKVEVGDPPKEETLDHQAVTKFAELMKHELDENFEKKHGRENWLKGSPIDHVLQVYYHTGKLQMAVKALELLKKDKNSSRHEIQFQEFMVREYAADVGNHAMMVLDVLRLLGVPLPEAKKAEPKKEEYKYTWFS